MCMRTVSWLGMVRLKCLYGVWYLFMLNPGAPAESSACNRGVCQAHIQKPGRKPEWAIPGHCFSLEAWPLPLPAPASPHPPPPLQSSPPSSWVSPAAHSLPCLSLAPTSPGRICLLTQWTQSWLWLRAPRWGLLLWCPGMPRFTSYTIAGSADSAATPTAAPRSCHHRAAPQRPSSINPLASHKL